MKRNAWSYGEKFLVTIWFVFHADRYATAKSFDF
jgi:hypothetical protein